MQANRLALSLWIVLGLAAVGCDGGHGRGAHALPPGQPIMPPVEPGRPLVQPGVPPVQPGAHPGTPVAAARACGRLPHEPPAPQVWPFGDTGLGTRECDEAETTWANVPHADRACQQDQDCVVVTGNGSCFNAALTRAAASRPEYQRTPCGNPAAGACAARPLQARCSEGCCDVR